MIQLGDPLCLKALLGASIALHLSVFLFWVNQFYLSNAPTSSPSPHTVSWTSAASLEAEFAAAYNCSGHGSVPIDLLRLGQKTGVFCECDECFAGPACEHAVPDCKANFDSGDPLIFEPYWRQNSEAGSVLIPGWYRIGYELSQPLIPGLEEEIRAIHSLVGNAVTKGRYILVGTGATQIMAAAYVSHSLDAQGLPVRAILAPPYYEAYRRQIEMVKPGGVKWTGFSESLPLEGGFNGRSIEVVTSPNNPDGSLRESVFSGAEYYTIYDHAYYWPHYTPITRPSDHDLMVFSLSKLTGHAGSRVGWAIVKDYSLYQKLLLSVRLFSVGVSHDSQLRATHLIRAVRDGYTKSGNPSLKMLPEEHASQHRLFHYGHAKLRKRWDGLIPLVKVSDRFSIQQDLEPKYCNFFKDTVQPAPAFAWIRCEREEDRDCPSLWEKAGIAGRGGKRSGATDQYVRIAMMGTDVGFDNLIGRIQALITEQGIKASL